MFDNTYISDDVKTDLFTLFACLNISYCLHKSRSDASGALKASTGELLVSNIKWLAT